MQDYFNNIYQELYTTNTEATKRNILCKVKHNCNRKVVFLEIAKLCFVYENLELLKLVKEELQIESFPKEWLTTTDIPKFENPEIVKYVFTQVNDLTFDDLVEHGQLELVKILFENCKASLTTLLRLQNGYQKSEKKAERKKDYFDILIFLTNNVPSFNPDSEFCNMHIINSFILSCLSNKEEENLDLVTFFLTEYRKPIAEFYRINFEYGKQIKSYNIPCVLLGLE